MSRCLLSTTRRFPRKRKYGLWVVTLVSGAILPPLWAQETVPGAPTPPSTGDPYLDMRESEDRTTQRYAERYFNLVKLQAWTSANNKSTVNAKYVAHDPDLKWVKLATVKGSGRNRVVKEVTVEVAKLNKTCQSRVRQIAALQTKLDELAAEAKDNPATGESGYGEYGRARSEYGAPMTDERGEQPAVPDGAASTDPAMREYGSQPAASPAGPPTPVIDPNDPDPLGFAEVANQVPAAGAPDPRSEYFSIAAGPTAAGLPRAGAASQGSWKTSYPAFHVNFKVTQAEQGEPTIDWGELDDLRALNKEAIKNAAEERRDPYGQQSSEIVQRLGEISWEGPYAGLQQLRNGEHEVRFNLPPLPPPLKIRFILDGQDPPDVWTGLRPGQPVQFLGRLSIVRPGEIIVRIRKSS